MIYMWNEAEEIGKVIKQISGVINDTSEFLRLPIETRNALLATEGLLTNLQTKLKPATYSMNENAL